MPRAPSLTSRLQKPFNARFAAYRKDPALESRNCVKRNLGQTDGNFSYTFGLRRREM